MAARTGSTGAATYADCVDSLRNSLKFLEASVETIDRGVSDFPRLVNVLKTVRHYELIPQPTLAAAEASLRDEIGPYIAFLLSRADAQVERQERRIETLKARAELQQGRLTRPDEPARSASKPASTKSRQLRGEDKLRARIVRQRKEALRYGIERLELESGQKTARLLDRFTTRDTQRQCVLVPLPLTLLNHHNNAGKNGFHDAFVSAKSRPHTGLTSSVRPPIALGQTCLLRARVAATMSRPISF
ncbi:Spc19 domain-containing protein [Trichoderma velutinum]